MTENLEALFLKEKEVLVAYLFGSYAEVNQTAESDVDVAVLMSEIPQKIAAPSPIEVYGPT